MKKLISLILLFLSLQSINVYAQSLNSFSELIWKNRIIVVQGDKDDLSNLIKNKKEFLDRDVVWFLLNNESVHTNSKYRLSKSHSARLEREYFDNDMQAILIGKDGGVKAKQLVFDLSNFLAKIDTMPMRIQEMRQ